MERRATTAKERRRRNPQGKGAGAKERRVQGGALPQRVQGGVWPAWGLRAGVRRQGSSR